MKPSSRSLFSTALALVVSPILSAAGPHPTAVLLVYKGNAQPVIRIVDTDPVILVDGKEKVIRSQPTYLMERAPSYSSEYVEITQAMLGAITLTLPTEPGQEATFAPVKDAAMGFLHEFEVTLKPLHAIKGGFMAVGTFSPSTFSNRDGAQRPEFQASMQTVGQTQTGYIPAEVNLHGLPDLLAGQETKVHFSTNPFSGGMNYYIQVFDGKGQEVRTNLIRLSWPFYAMTEQSRLEQAIEKYRKQFPGADHPLQPVVMIKPLFTEKMIPPTHTVIAILRVSADGRVEKITLPAGDDVAVDTAIHEALSGWLFLPRLKAGQPVATQVQVPLNF